MRFVALISLVLVGGCLRIIDLDDDDPDTDASVIVFDASPFDGAPSDSEDVTSCSVELPCPAPDAGRATICGRIYDAETDALIPTNSPTGQPCTGPTAAGPCSLRVRYFDALDFAMNPNGAVPIQPQTAIVDDCGRFRATNLTRATFGFISVAVDDAPGVTPLEPHRLTSVVTTNGEASPGRIRAYSARVSTDNLWTSMSGVGGAQTLAERGVLVKVFTHRGVPVAGVTARRNSATIGADDHYFSDAGITRRVIDGARTATGPNGSVLILNNATPVAHDGVGAEPSGCMWPSNLGASIPGAISIDFAEAETPAGALCP